MFLQPDLPKATSDAPVTATTAAPGAPAASSANAQATPFGGQGGMLMMMLVLMGGMLFFSWRRQKTDDNARKTLKVGDRVLIQGGLFGELVEVGEKSMKVKIAAGTVVEALTLSVSAVSVAKDAPKGDQLADLRDSKTKVASK